MPSGNVYGCWPSTAIVGLESPACRQDPVTLGSTYETRARRRANKGGSNWSPTGSFVAAVGTARTYSAMAADGIRAYNLAGEVQASEAIAALGDSGISFNLGVWIVAWVVPEVD